MLIERFEDRNARHLARQWAQHARDGGLAASWETVGVTAISASLATGLEALPTLCNRCVQATARLRSASLVAPSERSA